MGGVQDKADKQKLGAAVFGRQSSQVRLLICVFARNRNMYDWQMLYEENQQFFRALAPGMEIIFALANEEDFTRQVAAADIVFFSGGDSVPLYSALARIGNEWMDHLDGKTVIGTSAGSDMLSAYIYDLQQGALDLGLGLVKVKTIPHYGGGKEHEPEIGWEKALEELRGYGEDLPVYALREGEFISLTSDI